MRASFTDRINLLREFLTLGFLGTIASVVGIAGGLNSMFGSSSQPSAPTSGAAPSYYQPTGQPQADQSWLNAMNQINSGVNAQSGMVQPQLNSAYQNMTNVNPSGYVNAGNRAGSQYAQQAQLAAMYQQMMQGQAGTSAGAQQTLMGQGNQQYGTGSGQQALGQSIYGNAAPLTAQGNQQFGSGQGMQNAAMGQQAIGQGMYGNAQPLMAAGNQMWNTVQNPQSGLYNQMLQQTQDTSNAATSMRGIGMSPEAAGIENQAVNQFNNAWNNNFVQNQASGLNATSGAYNAGAGQLAAGTSAYGAGTSAYDSGTSAVGQGGNLYNAAANQYGAGTSAFSAGTGAANAGTSAYNAAGNQGQLTGANLQSASNYGGQIPTNTLQSGAVPFNTAQTAYGAPITATNAYTGAMNQGVYQPYGAIQTNAMPYMNYGMNSANNAFGTGAAQQTFNANQQAAGMNGLTQGLNQLSNNQPSWMSGMFGGGQPSNTDTSGGYYNSSAPTGSYNSSGGQYT